MQTHVEPPYGDKESPSKEFTDVNRSKSGANRENSLYYYAIDHLDQEPLKRYQCSERHSDSRDVVYCELPLNAIENYEEDYLEPVFAEFTWVRGQNRHERHLSIDKKTFYANAHETHEQSIAHATLTFENATERRIAHVHYNRNRQVIGVYVKSGTIEAFEQNSPLEYLLLTETQREKIRILAMPCQLFLIELTQAKQQVFSDLYHKAEELNVQLMSANLDGNREQTIKYACLMRDVTEKISRYNDMQTDGRIRFLNNFIENLLRAPRSAFSDSHTDIEPEPGRTVIVPTSSVSVPKLSKKEKEEEVILESLVRLVNVMKTTDSLSNTYIEHWDELEKLVSWIELLGTPKAQDILKKQSKKLPIPFKLFDYFQTCVKDKDVEKVQILHPIVIKHTDLRSFYTNYISEIHGLQQSPRQLTLEDIQIADFFYENSSVYQYITHLIHAMHQFFGESHVTLSPLLSAYRRDDLDAFKMMLRQGVSLTESQMQQGTSTMHGFDALQSIIILYKSNPNLRRIEFLRELLSYKMNIDSLHFTSRFGTNQENHKILGKNRHPKPSFFQSPASIQLDEIYDGFSKIKNTLMLAVSVHKKQPELIAALLPYADLEHTLLALGTILGSKHFINRYISGRLASKLCCFKNKQACDTFTQSEEAAIHLPSVGHRNYLLFYPRTDQETEQQVQCAEIMIESLVNHNSCNVDWSGLLKKFTVEAQNQQKSDTDDLPTYLFAAQIAYCLMSNPGLFDHQAMLQIFAILGKKSTKDYGVEAGRVQYKRGLALLDNLPCEERDTLIEKTNIVPYLFKHANTTDTKAASSLKCCI